MNLQANDKTRIKLNFDLLPEPLTVEVSKYNEFLQKITLTYRNVTVSEKHDEFLSNINSFVDNCFTEQSKHKKSMLSVFYLLTGILIENHCEELKYGFQLTFKSGITMGAGLGSSASFGVCVAAVFSFYSRFLLRSHYVFTF